MLTLFTFLFLSGNKYEHIANWTPSHSQNEELYMLSKRKLLENTNKYQLSFRGGDNCRDYETQTAPTCTLAGMQLGTWYRCSPAVVWDLGSRHGYDWERYFGFMSWWTNRKESNKINSKHSKKAADLCFRVDPLCTAAPHTEMLTESFFSCVLPERASSEIVVLLVLFSLALIKGFCETLQIFPLLSFCFFHLSFISSMNLIASLPFQWIT